VHSTRGSRATTTRGAPVVRAAAAVRLSRISAFAWAAGLLTLGFIGLTAWWLSVDASVQYNDGAQHLFFAFSFRDALDHGALLRALGFGQFYPPATYLLGAVSTVVGGVSVATPVLAQNVLYVPLLAVACYRLARRTHAPSSSGAGLLAVVFALGAPLIIEQFHVFMLDAPLTALVAATVWLLIESERFARVGLAALAGLTFGLAVATKSLAPAFVIGVLACVLVRGGGWRNWRGLLAFAAVAFAVGAPWYLRQLALGNGDLLLEAAGSGRDVPPAAAPPTLSLANLAWYGWATLNGLLFAPLFAFAAVGVGAAIARVRRLRPLEDPTLELLCGLGAAWLLLLLMPHHDMRYTMQLLVFLAVLGTTWVVRLPPAPRAVAATVLIGAICAAHLGATFGVGGETTRRLPGNRNAAYGEGVPPRGRVIVYASENFMVSAPHARPDVLRFFGALRREGIAEIGWEDRVERWDRAFEEIGLVAFAYVARVGVTPEEERTPAVQPGQALLIRAHALGGAGAPCIRLRDGTAVWARMGVAGQLPQTRCPAGWPGPA
jgi:4-amino-4-deoxy-L-arabinose transferase-like glycosyltransferase